MSFSSSQKHALRGLHCSPYGKFITCVRGEFYDVIADFREDSPTFGRWCGVWLSETNKKQVYVKTEEVKKEISELEYQVKKDLRKKKEKEEAEMKYHDKLDERMENVKSEGAQNVFERLYSDELGSVRRGERCEWICICDFRMVTESFRG